MALFGDSVPPGIPAGIFEQVMAAMERERERSHQVTMEALELKRHELGMVPKGWAPPPDPLSLLGPLTQGAIEEFAAGDADLRRRLITTASTMAELRQAAHLDPADADEEIAALIRAGDQ
jgi:hypothetical protein